MIRTDNGRLSVYFSTTPLLFFPRSSPREDYSTTIVGTRYSTAPLAHLLDFSLIVFCVWGVPFRFSAARGGIFSGDTHTHTHLGVANWYPLPARHYERERYCNICRGGPIMNTKQQRPLNLYLGRCNKSNLNSSSIFRFLCLIMRKNNSYLLPIINPLLLT